MKAAAITSPGRVELVDRERPRAHRDLVVVKILIAPMCTEFKDRRAGNLSDTLGHEAAGIVVDAGESTRVQAGDRVVVMPQNGCGVCSLCTAGEHIHCPDQRDVLTESGNAYGTATYAEYALKPDWLLLPVPDDIPLRRAALTVCGLGPGFTAHTRMDTGALDTVLVSGCGPVGLGAIIHAAVRGARVLALENQEFRKKLALELGAAKVLDPGALAPGELTGVDAAVETSGAPGAASLAAHALRPRGRLSIVAWGSEVVLPPLVPIGADVFGCWHWNHQRYADRMWTSVRAAADALDTMVTARFPLDDVSGAMDLQDTGECGKVFLLPHGEGGLR
ncbi:zinc-dependent alcohol dehydrogenase [Streptomyces iranensis]|uniref:zinc-dependent alcohol dehydrogenase n=1 Tax=Streptomyces iranensis TaxID=576784 RepID=UPI0039B76FA4